MSISSFNSSSKHLSLVLAAGGVLLLLLLQACSHVVECCVEEERLALLDLMSYMKSFDQWSDNPYWSYRFDGGDRYNCCAWDVVRCNPLTGRVNELKLDRLVWRFLDAPKDFMFNVTLFRPFSQLRSLDLSLNDINGLVESDGSTRLSTLKNVQHLSLGWNDIQLGYFSVSALISLKTLSADNCGWTSVSCWPSGLCKLKNLQELHLGGNSFYGDLDSSSSCLRNLTSLRVLDLSFNHFTGKIASTLANLTSLQFLDLYHNNIEDTVFLSSFANFSKLETLVLSRNRLQVQTENSLWQPTFQLQTLVLDGCSLNKPYGTFPTFLMHQYNLTYISLSHNDLVGPFPTWLLTNNSRLTSLHLTNNHLTGHLQFPSYANRASGASPIEDFEGLCKLKNLQRLHLGGNSFYGDLDSSCLRNLTSLRVLDLSSNNFTGKIASTLANLTSLQYLDLSDNNFEDTVFLSSFANFSKLETLGLSRNRLQVQTESSLWQPTFQLQFLSLYGCSLNKPYGTFPTFLMHQYNLTYISLSHNDLVGPFPNWLLTNNSRLTSLYLTDNNLTGHLQFPAYANFSLSDLDVSDNEFQGKIPENIGLMFSQIAYLNMSGNHFEGNIPISVGHLRNLQSLDLSGNNLSGELPRQFLSDCGLLELLDLSGNHLEGDLVSGHMNLTNLLFLMVNNNMFGGTIKDALLDALGQSPLLLYLDISNNNITGELPKGIGNLRNLSVLSASNNLLEGLIPTEICNLSTLGYLDLSQNNFRGPIPSCSNLRYLEYIHLDKNRLTGQMPHELSSCSTLKLLDLRDNHLSGNIPSWIHMLSNLRMLLLGGNNLHGPIPHQMCQLASLNLLDLSRNRLSGGIPICLGNMPLGMRLFDIGIIYLLYIYNLLTLKVEFLAKNNHLSYTGSNLKLMSGLDLSCNNLTGVIPPELGHLTYVHSINLSHNFISGSIPNTFSNVKQIESLDLSFNNLSGTVPHQLVELNFLEVFNVSYNNLTGRTPDSGQFAGFVESSYLGNPGLCCSVVNKSCTPGNEMPPPSSPAEEEDDGDAGIIDMVDFLWSFGVSSFIMFLATIAVLCINPHWLDFFDRYILWRLPLPMP